MTTPMCAQPRSEDSKAFKKITFEYGNYRIRYAWVSQRGYYPEDLNKANQDAHIELERFAESEGVRDCAFFCVFDGHGTTGDACAHFARDEIPLALARELGKLHRESRANDVGVAYRISFVDVNERLHAHKACDDTMSGTTASKNVWRAMHCLSRIPAKSCSRAH